MFGKKGVKLFIVARRAGTLFMLTDTCKRISDKATGTDLYKLRKMKDNMRPIEFEHIIQNTLGNFAPVYSPAKGEYFPMAVTESYRQFAEIQEPVMEEYVEEVRVPDKRVKPLGYRIQEVKRTRQKSDKNGDLLFGKKTVEMRTLLEPVNEDQKAFLITEHERAMLRFGKQSFWQKYAYLIGPLICGVALAMIFLFWSMAAKEVVGGLGVANMAQQVMDAAKTAAASGAGGLAP